MIPRKGLVCALADAPMTIPGSTFHRECVECHRKLMVSPTGEAVLREKPTLETICLPCAERLHPKDLAEGLPAAHSIEELVEGVLSAVPNLRRHRN
jgi:hypothetical protein